MWCELAEMELNGRYTHARIEQKFSAVSYCQLEQQFVIHMMWWKSPMASQARILPSVEGRSRPAVVKAVTGWRTHCVQLLHYRLDLPSSLKREGFEASLFTYPVCECICIAKLFCKCSQSIANRIWLIIYERGIRHFLWSGGVVYVVQGKYWRTHCSTLQQQCSALCVLEHVNRRTYVLYTSNTPGSQGGRSVGACI